MARQGRFDAQLEGAKSALSSDCTVEAAFAVLDRHQKGFVSETDLILFAQDFDRGGGAATSSASYSGLRALVREAQLRRSYDAGVVPGRFSFRDLAVVMLPAEQKELDSVLGTANDSEARSVLYLLRHSEPCPRCGIRVQRDAEAAGCPSVTCPICGTLFRCFCVMGDRHTRPRRGSYGAVSFADGSCGGEGQLSRHGRHQLFRFLAVAARVAEDLDLDRRGLATKPAACDLASLGDAFAALAAGRASFVEADLRWAFNELGVALTEHELRLLWLRYAAPRPPDGVRPRQIAFADFARQLRPGSALHP